jgi:hypothetical protein
MNPLKSRRGLRAKKFSGLSPRSKIRLQSQKSLKILTSKRNLNPDPNQVKRSPRTAYICTKGSKSKSKREGTVSKKAQTGTSFQERLDSQWMWKLEELKKYQKDFNTCRVNVKSHSQLYYWAIKQHRGYYELMQAQSTIKKRRGVTLERAAMLKSIGFFKSWEQGTKLNENKSSNVRPHCTHDSNPRGTASKLPSQKAATSKKRNETSREKISSLRNDAKWASHFEELRDFRGRYGTCRIPTRLCGPLYEWAYKQVKGYARMKRGDTVTHGMSPTRARRLQSINFFKSWQSTNPVGHVMIGVRKRIARENAKKKGSHVTRSGNADTVRAALSSGPRRTDKAHRSPFLTAACETPLQRAALRAKVGIDQDAHCVNMWKGHFQDLLAYKKIRGHCRVTTAYNLPLYKWAVDQAAGHRHMLTTPSVKDRRRRGMTEARAKILKSLGFFEDWNGSDAPSEKVWKTKQSRRNPLSTQKAHQENRWKERFRELVKYKGIHGDCRVTSTYSQSLYNWAYAQAAGYKQMVAFPGVKDPRYSGMDEARAGRLRSIGFFDDWDNIKAGGEKIRQTMQSTRHSQPNHHFDRNFVVLFKEMRQYKAKHGTTRVNKNHDQRLYQWALRLSNYARNGKLHPRAAKKLEEIGLFRDWNVALQSSTLGSKRTAKRQRTFVEEPGPRVEGADKSTTSSFASSQGSVSFVKEEFESASRNSSSAFASSRGSVSSHNDDFQSASSSTSSRFASSRGSCFLNNEVFERASRRTSSPFASSQGSVSSRSEEFAGALGSTSSTMCAASQGSLSSSSKIGFESASRKTSKKCASSQGGESVFSFSKECIRVEKGVDVRRAARTQPASYSHNNGSNTEKARIFEGAKRRRKVVLTGASQITEATSGRKRSNSTSSCSPPCAVEFDRAAFGREARFNCRYHKRRRPGHKAGPREQTQD